jgi:hypothetical protein
MPAKYSSVCGWELCYTEQVISNWISVAPLGRRPFYRVGGYFIPALPDIYPLG